MNIGKIEIVPIRQAFAYEALNFTVWLEQNIDALSDRLGIELSVIEREKRVGSFNVEVIQPFEKREDSAKWLKTLPKEINHEHYPNQCNRRAI